MTLPSADVALPPGGVARQDALRALRETRAAWPIDPVLAAEWAQRTGLAPPPPRSGEVILVSVTPTDGRAALWVTAEGDANTTVEAVPLQGLAAESARRGLRLALRDHPLPVAPRLRAAVRRLPTFVARRVRKVGSGRDSSLDGASFGLALGLAAASWLADTPVRDGVVALATLDASGRTGRVEGLKRKLQMVGDLLPGVTTVLVAPEQAEDAKTLLAEGSGRDLAVQAVASLGGALEAFLPLDVGRLRSLGAEQARDAALQMGTLAVRGAPVALTWRGVADVLTALLEEPSSIEGDERRWAEVGRAAALRHVGAQSGVTPWESEWLERLPRPLRLKVAAHLVQEASDGDHSLHVERLGLASDLLAPPNERHSDDLRLLGALGRLQAALHRWDDAADSLEATIGGWLALGRPQDASHPLCELLRVRGILGDANAVATLRAGWVARVQLDPAVTDTSAAYLLAALGRAEVQSGAPERAVQTLAEDAADWDHQAPHLRSGRLRWLAQARQLTGDEGGADVARRAGRLVVQGVAGHEEFGLLIELDEGLLRGEDGVSQRDALAAGGRSRPEMERLAALGCVEPRMIGQVWRY